MSGHVLRPQIALEPCRVIRCQSLHLQKSHVPPSSKRRVLSNLKKYQSNWSCGQDVRLANSEATGVLQQATGKINENRSFWAGVAGT
jgi:hypothetical protein